MAEEFKHAIKKNFPTEILKYLNLDMENGPWLAGSMARKLYMKEEPGYSDWDIWFKNEQQYIKTSKLLNNLDGCHVSFESENADTYTHQLPIDFSILFKSLGVKPENSENNFNDLFVSEEITEEENDEDKSEHKIQLIRRRYYNSPQEIINNFDFTVCQVATDGKTFIFGDNTKDDIENKRLRYTPSSVRENIVARIIKYTVYGFKPSQELLEYVFNNKNNIDWNKGLDDYDAI